jgi:hypothetical protein
VHWRAYLAALTVAWAVAAAAGCQRRTSAPLPDAAKPLGLLSLPTLAGPTFDPVEVAGRVVAINFWSPS